MRQNLEYKQPLRFSKAVGRGLVIATSLFLVACQSSNFGVSGTQNNLQNNTPRVLSANPKGDVFGQGTVRVALLLPKSAAGNGAAVANEIRNGALLAMSDFGNKTLQLVIKDTAGQASSAQGVANEAVLEGSSAIIGPLFSGSVSAASGITQPANVTMFAFSTDTSVAKRGVYLISFTPQGDTKRMITFAASKGRRSVLALLPNNAEGAVRESVLKKVAATSGMVVSVVKYDRNAESIRSAIGASSSQLEGADSIYIPDGGPVPGIMLSTMKELGLSIKGKQVLGSGNWETVKLSDRSLSGALYPKRDISNFTAFAQRYQTTYNSKPGVQAALGYDAVTLVSELVRQNGAKRAFSSSVIENRRGFTGTNGLFRLLSNGTTERGLAIYQINNGREQLVSPAPKTFSRSGS